MFSKITRLVKTAVCMGALAMLPALSAQSLDWSQQVYWETLDPYQKTLSYNDAQDIIEKLLVHPDYKTALFSRMILTKTSLQAFAQTAEENPDRTPLYTFYFGDNDAPKPSFSIKEGKFSGFSIALAPNPTRWGNLTMEGSDCTLDYPSFSRLVSAKLQEKLTAAGAQVTTIDLVAQGQPYSVGAIANQINALNDGQGPTFALCPHFNIGRDTAPSLTPYPDNRIMVFAPGCFMDEAKTERTLFRFMHDLVTGKAVFSAVASLQIASALHKTLQVPLWPASSVGNDFFGNGACPISATTEEDIDPDLMDMVEDGKVLGVATRNLYINGVFAPATVYGFPLLIDNFEQYQQICLNGPETADKVAEAYVKGIQDFVSAAAESSIDESEDSSAPEKDEL